MCVCSMTAGQRVTRDGSLSAHFEHSVAVTAAGPLVLSVCGEKGGAAAQTAEREPRGYSVPVEGH